MANEDDLKTWLQIYKQTSTDEQQCDIQLLKEQAAANYEILRNFNFDDGRTLLHIAVARNHRQLIKCLFEVLSLSQLIDMLNKRTDSEEFYASGDNSYYGTTAIHYAALYNRHEILTDILNSVKSAGCSPLWCLTICDDSKCSPAYIAAHNDNLEALESMFEAVTPNEHHLLIMQRGMWADTLLHLAASQGNLQIVKLIQKYTTSDQMYTIMKATCDFYKQDYTILHKIVSSRAPPGAEMITTLMDLLTDRQKVDVLEMSTRYEETAKKLALRNNYDDTAELLEEIYTKAMISICLDTSDKDGKSC